MKSGALRDHARQAWLSLEDAYQEVADRGSEGQLAQEGDRPVASMKEPPVTGAVAIENRRPVPGSSLKVLVDHVAGEQATAEGEQHPAPSEGVDEGTRVADGEDSRR
jgi:hypothetical protein